MVDVEVRAPDSATMAELASLFRSWPKPPELFDHYARRADDGHIDFMTARVQGQLAGYCLIEWTSAYPPFAAAGIPEICDLTVTRELRGNGAGRALLDEAENRVARRSPVVGIRVGLYADYGKAQRIYALRNYIPDGRGASVNGRVAEPGSTVKLDDGLLLALTRRLHG